MTIIRNITVLCLRGVLTGSLLGLLIPIKPAFAACTCRDDGAGKYKCNVGQTGCLAGTDWCLVQCS